MRGELSIINDLLLFRDRIVVPNSMRIDILNRIHDGHMSVNKCRARASNSVWWPFISRDISNFVERCNFCQVNRKKQNSVPLKPTELPDRPCQRLGLDLFELNCDKYLIIVDYYSRCSK